MATPIDVQALVGAIIGAATDRLGKDITTLEGFAEDQVAGLARQAQLIAGATAAGHLSDSDLDADLNQLKGITQDFANTLAGLAVLEIEKVWNAAVDALWKAIGTATGVALPKPF
jgi:hypothetical protein